MKPQNSKQTDPTADIPETVSQRIIQNFFAGIPGGELQRLVDAAPETAAERDRLVKALEEIWPRAIKAEGQVKTLLAAHRRIVARIVGEFDNSYLMKAGALLVDRIDDVLKYAREAIASVESEQAK